MTSNVINILTKHSISYSKMLKQKVNFKALKNSIKLTDNIFLSISNKANIAFLKEINPIHLNAMLKFVDQGNIIGALNSIQLALKELERQMLPNLNFISKLKKKDSFLSNKNACFLLRKNLPKIEKNIFNFICIFLKDLNVNCNENGFGDFEKARFLTDVFFITLNSYIIQFLSKSEQLWQVDVDLFFSIFKDVLKNKSNCNINKFFLNSFLNDEIQIKFKHLIFHGLISENIILKNCNLVLSNSNSKFFKFCYVQNPFLITQKSSVDISPLSIIYLFYNLVNQDPNQFIKQFLSVSYEKFLVVLKSEYSRLPAIELKKQAYFLAILFLGCFILVNNNRSKMMTDFEIHAGSLISSFFFNIFNISFFKDKKFHKQSSISKESKVMKPSTFANKITRVCYETLHILSDKEILISPLNALENSNYTAYNGFYFKNMDKKLINFSFDFNNELILVKPKSSEVLNVVTINNMLIPYYRPTKKDSKNYDFKPSSSFQSNLLYQSQNIVSFNFKLAEKILHIIKQEGLINNLCPIDIFLLDSQKDHLGSNPKIIFSNKFIILLFNLIVFDKKTLKMFLLFLFCFLRKMQLKRLNSIQLLTAILNYRDSCLDNNFYFSVFYSSTGRLFYNGGVFSPTQNKLIRFLLVKGHKSIDKKVEPKTSSSFYTFNGCLTLNDCIQYGFPDDLLRYWGGLARPDLSDQDQIAYGYRILTSNPIQLNKRLDDCSAVFSPLLKLKLQTIIENPSCNNLIVSFDVNASYLNLWASFLGNLKLLDLCNINKYHSRVLSISEWIYRYKNYFKHNWDQLTANHFGFNFKSLSSVYTVDVKFLRKHNDLFRNAFESTFWAGFVASFIPTRANKVQRVNEILLYQILKKKFPEFPFSLLKKTAMLIMINSTDFNLHQNFNQLGFSIKESTIVINYIRDLLKKPLNLLANLVKQIEFSWSLINLDTIKVETSIGQFFFKSCKKINLLKIKTRFLTTFSYGSSGRKSLTLKVPSNKVSYLPPETFFSKKGFVAFFSQYLESWLLQSVITQFRVHFSDNNFSQKRLLVNLSGPIVNPDITFSNIPSWFKDKHAYLGFISIHDNFICDPVSMNYVREFYLKGLIELNNSAPSILKKFGIVKVSSIYGPLTKSQKTILSIQIPNPFKPVGF